MNLQNDSESKKVENEENVLSNSKLESRFAGNRKWAVVVLTFSFLAFGAFIFAVIPNMLAERNYEKGIEAIYSGDYEDAISHLEKSDASDADELIQAIKHHQEAISSYEEGEYFNAYEQAGLVPESYPEYMEVQKLYEKSLRNLTTEILKSAKEYFSEKEYIKAYKKLKQVLEYDPTHEEALQLKEKYKAKANDMEAQLNIGGFFMVDSGSIRQREKVNIDEWNTIGYTGKGLTILHDDTGDTMHSLNCAAILQTILPDAKILRGSISGTTDKDGVKDAYVTCYTTDETRVPFDEFVEKYQVSLINNSKAGGTGDSDSGWSVWMREKIKQYNIIGFGAAGNEGDMTNRFYGAFIMVSGVYLKDDDSIIGYRTSEDADFSMFMGYQGGTSYASPFLCGMAGLLKSKYPDMTQEEIYQYFKDHSMDLGTEGKNPEYGWGLPILGDPEE